jgi:hypothetical protein
MTSVIRYSTEPTNLRRQFNVQTYLGFGDNYYFFTVEGNKLYRIENDLSGNNNLWENIRVIRSGIARKFQALSMVRGNFAVASQDGVAWNSGAYLENTNTPIYNYQTNTVNDMLVLGHAETTVLNNYNENLPFGTFWAMNDPVVIEYEFSAVTYRRAIKNRIDETTLF